MKDSLKLLGHTAEDRYYKELARKDTINAQLSLPIALILAMIGVVGFFFTNFNPRLFTEPSIATICFMILFGIALPGLVICLLIAICFLKRVFLGLSYGYVPTPKQLSKYTQNLEKYYNQIGARNIDAKIEEDLQRHLINEYSKYTQNNRNQNIRKTYSLTKAKAFITLALVFLIISGLSFVVLQSIDKSTHEDIQKIEIIEEQ